MNHARNPYIPYLSRGAVLAGVVDWYILVGQAIAVAGLAMDVRIGENIMIIYIHSYMSLKLLLHIYTRSPSNAIIRQTHSHDEGLTCFASSAILALYSSTVRSRPVIVAINGKFYVS